MPGIARMLKRYTKQTLVYWEKVGSDGFGKPIYTVPIELKCRWEDKFQEVVTSDGRKVFSKGFIILGSRLLPGSLVFLGTMNDVKALPTYPNLPTMNQGGKEILLFNSDPDLGNDGSVYEAYI